MSKCIVCEKKKRNLVVCRSCGGEFCSGCGEHDRELCEDCAEYEGEAFDRDYEIDTE